MLPLLLASVRSGDKTRVEQLLNNGEYAERLSTDEYRELFKEAIVAKSYEVVQLFIDTKILYNERSPHEHLKAFGGRTLFGYAVLEMHDIEMIKTLTSNGYDMLSNEECSEFVSNLVENFTRNDVSGFNAHLEKLKIVLTLSSNISWQRTLRDLLYSESKIKDTLDSVKWIHRHFKYGYGLCTFKTVDKIHMELGEEMMTDAKKSIMSLEGADVNDYIFESFPPGKNVPKLSLLALAIHKHNAEIVKMLIEKGADVNMHSERLYEERLIKFTPFELAVETNFLECCSLLLENGANIFLQSYNFMGDIFTNTIRNENVEMLKLILKRRSYSEKDIQSHIDDLEKDGTDNSVKSEIKESLKVYKRFETFETTKTMKAILLIEYGTEQEALNFIEDFTVDELNEKMMSGYSRRRSWTLLTFATKMNKIRIAKALLDKGCNINLCSEEYSYFQSGVTSTTALMFAIEENNSEMCELLLNHGACKSSDLIIRHNSVLMCAFRIKNGRILSLLVQHLRDFNEVFILFAFINDPISLYDVVETFSLDVLCCILQRSSIGLQTWVSLIQRCLERRDPLNKDRAERGRCMFYLLVDHLPFVPKELASALSRQYEHELPGNSVEEERKRLQKRVFRCSSLQHCCRYAVRQIVHPFTESNIESLGLPLQIQGYLLDHPLKKYLNTDG